MEKKYWQLLLENWRASGRRGLSIPFIIGSQDYLPEHLEKQTLAELVADIADNREISVQITYCFHIEDLILEPLGEIPENGEGLVLSSFVNDLGNTTDEIIDNLQNRYDFFIEQGNYSINDGVRTPFTPDERIFIRNTFAAL